MKVQLIALSFALLFSLWPWLAWAQTQPACPTPPTSVAPSVKSESSFNSKNNLYTYSYKVENARSSPLDIDNFIIATDEAPLNPLRPKSWIVNFKNLPEMPKHISWLAASNEIKPGQSISGFSFQSARAPGPVRYYVRGNGEVPTTVPVGKDDEPTPNCPGFFFDSKPLEGDVVGVTKGPMPAGQVAASIRIHRAEFAAEHKAPYLECHDLGAVHVTLVGSEKFDVMKVDSSSITFGPSRAKPLSIKTIETELNESEKSELGMLEDKNKGKDRKKKYKSLLLKFAVKDLGIRCNLDHALFINGKISESPFFGGAEISPERCKAASAQTPTPEMKKRTKKEDAD